MHSKFRWFVFYVCFSLSTGSTVLAASAKSYQVTGPIVALTPTTITVQKDDEKWEIARDPEAKGDATLKVGDRVTIHYRMTATRIEGRAEKSADSSVKDADPGAKTKKKTER
jgi:hypothetical protein